MTRVFAIATALLLAGVPAALPQTNAGANTESTSTAEKVDTTTFVKKASASNEFEIKSSELAQQQASSEDVKAFAAQMIKDHTKAGEELKAALSNGDQTSATPEAAGPEAAMLKQLQEASGDSFEAKYIDMQAKAHREAVALFRNYAESGDDAALKEFAKKTLPVLEQHESHVKELQAAHKS